MVLYVIGGGHCGAFLTELIPEVPFVSSLRKLSPDVTEAQGIANDFAAGVRALSYARDGRQVIDDMYRTEVRIGEALECFRVAARLFATLSTFEDSEMKDIIESTLCDSVFSSRSDLQLMLGLTYPRQGISSAMELVDFAVTTGEMTGMQAGDVLACLETNLSFTPMQIISVEVASAELKRVIKPFRLHVISMMRSCSATIMDGSMASSFFSSDKKQRVCPDKTTEFFLSHPVVGTLLTAKDVVRYVDAVEEAHAYRKIQFNLFIELLVLIAQHCDPSPFEPTAWKLKSLLMLLRDRGL
jgi:hypothetical protein